MGFAIGTGLGIEIGRGDLEFCLFEERRKRKTTGGMKFWNPVLLKRTRVLGLDFLFLNFFFSFFSFSTPATLFFSSPRSPFPRFPPILLLLLLFYPPPSPLTHCSFFFFLPRPHQCLIPLTSLPPATSKTSLSKTPIFRKLGIEKANKSP